MMRTTAVFLLAAVSAVLCQDNGDWHVGADRVNPSGVKVHSQANVSLDTGSNGRLDGNVHGSRVFGGPYNGQQSVGGGVRYQHDSGLYGAANATHNTGQGTNYTGTVGGSGRVVPGNLCEGGGVASVPGQRRPDGQDTNMMGTTTGVIMAAVYKLLCQDNKDWQVGAYRVNPSGVNVHGHANVPLHTGSNGRLDGNVHGSRVFGGPSDGQQSVGGGVRYQHDSGLYGAADATHNRGQGTTYTGTVGGSVKVGPGTLSVGGGVASVPGQRRPEGQVGANYSIPF